MRIWSRPKKTCVKGRESTNELRLHPRQNSYSLPEASSFAYLRNSRPLFLQIKKPPRHPLLYQTQTTISNKSTKAYREMQRSQLLNLSVTSKEPVANKQKSNLSEPNWLPIYSECLQIQWWFINHYWRTELLIKAHLQIPQKMSIPTNDKFLRFPFSPKSAQHSA